MSTRETRLPIVTGTMSTLLLAGAALGGDVDLLLTPIDGIVEECEIVNIDLLVSSNDGSGQPFDALDAILVWDPAILELIGIDDSRAGAMFFVSDFLNDPDGINEDIYDGEAIYTAFAPPGNPIDAPGAPDGLIVTTIQFQAIFSFVPTTVAFEPTAGVFGVTQVILEGTTITGDIDDDAPVQVGTCPGDLNIDGRISFEDLLRVLSAWGPCGECCAEDLSNSNEVDFEDILIVLSGWGDCP